MRLGGLDAQRGCQRSWPNVLDAFKGAGQKRIAFALLWPTSVSTNQTAMLNAATITVFHLNSPPFLLIAHVCILLLGHLLS